MKPITKMTERETIESILSLYTSQKDAVRRISDHISQILRRRRVELKNARHEA